MNMILRGGLLFIAAVALLFLVSCAPNQAMTRSDGMAGHDLSGGTSAQTREDDKYAANDDFDVESTDLDSSDRGDVPAARDKKVRNTPAPKVRNAAPAQGKDSDTVNLEVGGNDKFYQTGIASWYGREFHGKKTASGEKFDMNELTAAHRTLPLGSVVMVKNLDNGKNVRVRINDRGPFKGKRILDLSYAAAKKIDMIGEGEARVGIKVLGAGSRDYSSNDTTTDDEASGLTDVEQAPPVKARVRATEKDSSAGRDGVSLQAGAFYSKKNADKLKDKISEIMPDYDIAVVHDGDLFKVRVTGLRSDKDAERFKKELSRQSIEAFVIEQE